jgi:nucleotide-binding universal stress UspA family protein
MYRHILIATDGSDLSAKALEAGLQLAMELRARATVVTVTPPFHALSLAPSQAEYSASSYHEHAAAVAGGILEAARARAEAAGLFCDTLQAVHDHPWQAIIDTAQARGCDLITMASHGRRGATAILLGSETLRVLTHSSIPVLVYR